MIVALCADCGEDCIPVLDCYFCGCLKCDSCTTAVEDIGQICVVCISMGRGQPKPEEDVEV